MAARGSEPGRSQPTAKVGGVRLESDLQQRSVAYWERRGFLCRKLSTGGPFEEGGWPDFLVYGAHPVLIHVEFKRAGESLDKRQEKRLDALWARGFAAYKIESLDEAVELVRNVEEDLDAYIALFDVSGAWIYQPARKRCAAFLATLRRTADVTP